MGGGLKMGQPPQKWDKIIDLFFQHPSKSFQLREIARLSSIPKTTVQRAVRELLKTKIIVIKKNTTFPAYIANESNFWYKFYKKYSILEKIYASGLVAFLEESFHPRCMILFGSSAKGEYLRESDLDIFLLAIENKINLVKYEKKLKHKINLLFKEDFNMLNSELFNNIINGVKLSGFIKLK